MIAKYLLFASLCLAVLVSPQALKSQTHLTIDSLELKTYSQTADFTLLLQSKDIDWKVADNGKSKADLILITASLDREETFSSMGGNTLLSRQILRMQ